jgi:dynein heavy chain
LLAVISQTLGELLQALKGLIVMSMDLEGLSNSLFNNQVPELWQAKAYPSLKPLSAWVEDLEKRLQFMEHWINLGPGNTPAVYWISGLFFPQAFLTGTLQNFARKYRVPVDTVSFDFEVIDAPLDSIARGPEDGCYIRGLFLEGARWNADMKELDESRPKELFTEMPIVWLKPVQNRKKSSAGYYDCPVYKTLQRAGTLSTTGHSTNFVLSIELPTSAPKSHWIKRGVALICGLNY